MIRRNFQTQAPLEKIVGYSRMVCVGDQIYIGGTTAVQPDGTVFGETAYEQAKYIFQKFVTLLKQADAKPSDAFRIKAYITDMALAKEVGEAYSEIFKEAQPLFTMVETPKLNRPTQLVEIELDAYRGCQVEA